MDLIHYVVKDGVLESANDRSLSRQVSAFMLASVKITTLNNIFLFSYSKQQTIEWDVERVTAFTCLKHFSRLVEMARPRFDRVASSSMGVSNSAGSGAAGGGGSSSAAQGTGKNSRICVCVYVKHLHIMKWEN
jgi:hypothetical protein